MTSLIVRLFYNFQMSLDRMNEIMAVKRVILRGCDAKKKNLTTVLRPPLSQCMLMEKSYGAPVYHMAL